jgi:ribosomal protein L24E
MAGHCYCCGKEVAPGSGWLVMRKYAYELVCDAHKNTPLGSRRAKKRTSITLNDILSAI